MNNSLKSPLASTTPIKRIGLSRKRKSLPQCGVTVKDNKQEDCSKRKIVKQDAENSNQLNTSTTDGLHPESGKFINSKSEAENPKYPKDMKEKITELENLYKTWKNGCKSALLYLLDKLKKTENEEVQIKELLQRLGILNVICNHFNDDSDLDFCISD